jgi:chitinase
VAPTNGTKIADLNPCPLNACCDAWGFCGTTSDFCTIALADTGAPGTHQPGTNGCVSNCGTDIVNNGSPPSSYSRIAYFEAFNQQRPCLTMDASQIDTTKFTHIHFAFGGVSGSYQVTIDSNSTDQFTAFTKISGSKKILSIGGWAFSTDPDTYSYFRTGVTAGNRQTFANNVASFVNSNGLDGVDFDWEYAGEPDIAGIPAGSADDGPNYLAFLKLVRAALGTSKSISVALPASFWYLRAFPVKDLQNVVDYFVYMTYDLHGQWDYGNANADTGCANGNCLRSHVNLTETTNALSMLTKAGVSSTKIMVGISNYGRSFRMSDSSCSGAMCTYTGGYDESNATPGICTGTAGYIADGEISDIISGGSDDWPIFQSYYDYDSNSDILIYGQDSSTADWVAYESPTTQNSRIDWAKGLNMAGTVTWAVDLEDWYDDPNAADEGWADLEDLDTTCDPSKMPNSLDDLANAQGGLEPPCWSRYAILLLENELESTISDYQDAANGYDDKFGYYVDWVKDSIDPQLQDYMKFMGKGQSFFDCDYTYGSDSGSSSCWGMPRFWDDDYSYTITFKLHDEDGFFNAIAADLGLDKSWVKFADYTAPYSCASDFSDDRPGGGNHPCRRLTHKYHGFPMKADNVQVANPKDIIQAAMPNITSLQNIMLGAGINMALGLYSNDTEDAVQASALPVFMLQDAVDSMKNIKDIGAKVAAEKKKSLILEILSIVLIVIPFVGEAVGAIFGGAAMIARIALIIGEVGNAALSIESIVADPLSAPFAILGLLAGGLGGGAGRAGRIEEDLFSEAAAARRAMKADDIGKFSQAFQKKDATVEQIVKACKRR